MNNKEFEQFVLNNGKDILRFCRITTGDTEVGDELYQDTMLKLLEKQARLDPSQNVKSYALSVAILLWKNKKRKYANRNRIISADSIDEMEEEGRQIEDMNSLNSPEQSAITKDETEMVRRIVASLPEKYRLPIQLFYSADMSVTEIGNVLRVPSGTVKSRMKKARSLIKEELEAIGYDR